MQIREALTPEHLIHVRALFAEYAAGLEVDLCFQGFAEELAGLPGRYARPGGGLWLAFDDDVAIGCIGLRPLDEARAELKRLYLRPGFRGTGLGRRLAETALDAAAAAGYASACLDTLPSMAGAMALYRAIGFVEIDAYCHNPVPGALFFERRLT